MIENNYSLSFFAEQGPGSEISAKVILPLILSEFFHINTLIDVGGGTGAWAACALELGVQDVKVIDGEWQNPQASRSLKNLSKL